MYMNMPDGSILINRAAQVLTLPRPGSKLLSNVSWFLQVILELLITVIHLLIFGLCLLIYLSSLFFLKDTIFVYKLSFVKNYLDYNHCNHSVFCCLLLTYITVYLLLGALGSETLSKRVRRICCFNRLGSVPLTCRKQLLTDFSAPFPSATIFS